MFVTALYKIYVNWIFCCNGIKVYMEVTPSGFIGSQILNFERSLSQNRAPKQSCSASNFLLDALPMMFLDNKMCVYNIQVNSTSMIK